VGPLIRRRGRGGEGRRGGEEGAPTVVSR